MCSLMTLCNVTMLAADESVFLVDAVSTQQSVHKRETRNHLAT